MTQSVVEKISIPEKTWRRQTDSPTWWIAFSCGSVILHLLAFWLISLYKLSASQSGSVSAVPIEFIEISPQKPPQAKPQPKPKTLPKPAIKPANTRPNQAVKPAVPQNSQPAVNPSAIQPPVIRNDEDAIAFNQTIEQKLAEQQRQQELLQQQQLAEQQRQQELQQQKLAEQQRQQELQQQQLAEQKLKNPADGEKIVNAPTDAQGKTPQQRAKAPQAPIQNQPNQSSGILTANWKIETDTFFKDKPDNLAQPLKRINSDIPLPPPQDGNFQPGEFLVWLTIDNQGNLLFIKVDESIPVALRSQYQEYAEKIFNDQKFIPASGNNGTKPELSNLPIRVNIQERSN